MTDSPLEQINLLHTDYAEILANSSDPLFELQLVRFEVNAASARMKTNFLTNTRHPRNHQLKTQGSPGLCAIAKRVSADVYFVCSDLAIALQVQQA